MNHRHVLLSSLARASQFKTFPESCLASCANIANHAACQNRLVGIQPAIVTHSSNQPRQSFPSFSLAFSSVDVCTHSDTLEQGISRWSIPRPSKQSAFSSARILGLSRSQISEGASAEKCRRAFCARRDTTATCTAVGIAPLYASISPARYFARISYRGRHSMRRDRASPYDSKIRVVMPPQRACALTSPAHACSASRETYAHRRRSSGASCALPEKNVITPEYRACRGVKSPSCFACVSARSTSSTARRNRSGSSLATTAAVAGSRNSVHTHRVCCHLSSDTSPIGVSSIFPSWKTVGGQRVSHAPSAREVIDGASGFRVPTRGSSTSICRRAKRSSVFP